MATVKKGDRVRIVYTGTLKDGTVFDSTHGSSGCDSGDCGCTAGPRELTVGNGEFLPQIEEALVGMKTGDEKSVIIPAGHAMGEYDEEKVISIPLSELPEDVKPAAGDQIVLVNENDEELDALVVEVDDESITLDCNHPLAGEDLTFQFKLVEIL
jgi:peptidylprolyl isomerase